MTEEVKQVVLTADEAIAMALKAASNGLIDNDNIGRYMASIKAVMLNHGMAVVAADDSHKEFTHPSLAALLQQATLRRKGGDPAGSACGGSCGINRTGGAALRPERRSAGAKGQCGVYHHGHALRRDNATPSTEGAHTRAECY